MNREVRAYGVANDFDVDIEEAKRRAKEEGISTDASTEEDA